MKIGFFLSGFSSGGIYNQTMGFLNLIKKIPLHQNDEICILSDEKVELDLSIKNFKVIYYKKTFLKRILFNVCDIIKKNKFIEFNKILNPFQNFLKKNNIDLIVFAQPSFYSLYCDGTHFIINIWNTEIKKYYNFNEFISGGFEYQNKIIKFATEKAFKIFVFTERNKKDLKELYNCRDEKIMIQNLTPNLPYIFDKNQKLNYLEIFNNFKLNKEFKWFFYPAQFWPHKNHKYLLDVMKNLMKKKLNKIGFIFCGPDKGNLEYINKTVEKENLNENVKILGFINDIEMISIYKNCQAVLMPTLLGRSSLPLLESLFFKKKIFYSKNILDDGLKKYVEEFDLNNPEDLSKKIEDFLKDNKNTNLNLKYNDCFNDKIFANNYQKVFKEFKYLVSKWRNI